MSLKGGTGGPPVFHQAKHQPSDACRPMLAQVM